MGSGFQRKIDNIVHSIVESEKVNNKEINETDISESIKKAISNLNDVGKILVLNDLSIDAGKTPSELLTLDGKISIERLNEIVNAKVEEAEKCGIDLKSNAPKVFKDDKLLIADAAITIAVLDTMIKNYDDLSNNDKQSLIEIYDDMPPEYQDAFNKAQADSLRK